MKIVVTGSNGRVGSRVVACALQRGHEVTGIDHTERPSSEDASNPNFTYIKADLREYETTLETLRNAGAEAVVHLAAVPHPGDYAATAHNTNVVISWNVLRASAELGITRIAQASSVNVMTLCYSLEPQIAYFPIDEHHPCEPDEPYGLSKQIAEMQADTIVRRFPSTRIASLRIHWSIPSRAYAHRPDPANARKDLWGYVLEDCAADAFILAVDPPSIPSTSNSTSTSISSSPPNPDSPLTWTGHERFFISAPDTRWPGPTLPLYSKYFPHVPLKPGFKLEFGLHGDGDGDLNGEAGTGSRRSFYDCSKAERMLGWRHSEPAPVEAELSWIQPEVPASEVEVIPIDGKVNLKESVDMDMGNSKETMMDA